jgi:uncharacterized protein (TIRG00374 family)
MIPSKKHPVRSLVVNAVLVALAFGLLALAVWQNQDQIRQVLSRRLDFRLFGLAFLVYMVGISLSFLRWFILVRVIEHRFTIAAAYLLGFIGNVFNLVIPGAVGGDFIKAAYLVRMDIKRTQAVASMVIDRILGLLGLFLLASVAGVFAWPVADRQVRILIALAWAASACGLFVLFLIFNQSLTRAFPGLLEGHNRFAGVLHELKVMSTTYRRRLGVVAVCLLISMAVHTMMVLGFYIVSRAIFPAGLPGLGQHLLIVPLTLFTTAVPLPFGALGLSEQVSSQLFAMVRHPGGALAMMAFRVLMYAGGLVSAAVYLANLRQVRSLTETAEELEEALAENELDEPEMFPGPETGPDPEPA